MSIIVKYLTFNSIAHNKTMQKNQKEKIRIQEICTLMINLKKIKNKFTIQTACLRNKAQNLRRGNRDRYPNLRPLQNRGVYLDYPRKRWTVS